MNDGFWAKVSEKMIGHDGDDADDEDADDDNYVYDHDVWLGGQ